MSCRGWQSNPVCRQWTIVSRLRSQPRSAPVHPSPGFQLDRPGVALYPCGGWPRRLQKSHAAPRFPCISRGIRTAAFAEEVSATYRLARSVSDNVYPFVSPMYLPGVAEGNGDRDNAERQFCLLSSCAAPLPAQTVSISLFLSIAVISTTTSPI